jgi:hypothetical protein
MLPVCMLWCNPLTNVSKCINEILKVTGSRISRDQYPDLGSQKKVPGSRIPGGIRAKFRSFALSPQRISYGTLCQQLHQWVP